MGKGSGLVYKTYLDGQRVFGCNECGTHLSTRDSVISRVNISLNSISMFVCFFLFLTIFK